MSRRISASTGGNYDIGIVPWRECRLKELDHAWYVLGVHRERLGSQWIHKDWIQLRNLWEETAFEVGRCRSDDGDVEKSLTLICTCYRKMQDIEWYRRRRMYIFETYFNLLIAGFFIGLISLTF